MASKNPSELIKRAHEIDEHIDAQTKRFTEYLKPYKDEREKLSNDLLAYLNENGGEAFKCDHGTAYLSEIMNVKVDPQAPGYIAPTGEEVRGRDALLDFALDNWDEIGSELLDVRPLKEPVRKWMDTHNGVPPPGLSISHFTRLNIRKS